MVVGEQALGPDGATEGLRSRKKRRTERAIRDAALELFSERGYDATLVEDIAARADVSVTTFFRYFASKVEVIFPGNQPLPTVRQLIVAQPASTSDLNAVRIALREGADAVRAALGEGADAGENAARLAQHSRAMMSSYVLLGRGVELILEYQDVIGSALAERRGLPEPDDVCRLTAAISMTALGQAWTLWERGGFAGLPALIDETFDRLDAVVRTRKSGRRTNRATS
jgi:AcrR family transcriptional regulator